MIILVVILALASADRRLEFRNTLRNEALIRANLLLEAEMDASALQAIYQETLQLNRQVEVAIYRPPFTLLYHDAIEQDLVKETPEMIRQILQEGEILFSQDNWEGIGLALSFEEQFYVVTAAAYDAHGFAKLQRLRNILLIIWLINVGLMLFAGRVFSRRALQPVAQLIEKADAITATNLNLRLSEGKGKDELSELAVTFNQMLDRLENSFDAQREFVSNISHEIRTPLTAILGETELALTMPRQKEDYERALKHIRQDALKLSRLSTSLLDLAKASYDQTEISLREVRLDEVLLDARHEVIKANAQYHVKLIISQDQHSDAPVCVLGNSYLLKVAFANLMDNACKFSEDNSCEVHLESMEEQVHVRVSDQGIGIAPEDLPHIFTPFYRGKNRKFIHGSGIGLPLVQQIINIHKGYVGVESVENEGTKVSVSIPIVLH